MNGAVAGAESRIPGIEALITRVSEMATDPQGPFRKRSCTGAFDCGRVFYGNDFSRQRNVPLVLAEDTGLELGAPSSGSVSLFLSTGEEGIVPEGMWLAGPDFKDIRGQSVSYAQVVMARVSPGFAPPDLNLRALMNLTSSIPGCMTRCNRGRIWIRLHRDLVEGGFSLADLGGALVSAYRRSECMVSDPAVLLVAGDDKTVSRLRKIQAMAEAINAESGRLRQEREGFIDCDELNCSSCTEQEFCGLLQKLISKRGKKR
ncbi:MAG TPA: hypothetical protein PK926_08250 [Spirochaetota bacterium]|nr:hypothetical protein [Spirochaetota bacterium]HPI88499.1 hypothetical protein [Spirochaetota bacterium]HPR47979.1 hypothetical protein [Spirochaetota bacterium]